ncbi:hypothetical protein CHS0354_019166 [Potamilus streckersoni]|uniref:Uncharacterized protein n=1 Tax=Potamilus streckersoni TaxID=2493646 RepID=A0AAE0SZS4_9BIVA|nr:hypothetical protein CHS0354_019166 [Potamilus streckersoni]
MNASVMFFMATTIFCLIYTGSLQSTSLKSYGSSSELARDPWQCIKQCLWAILEAIIKDKLFDVAWEFAKHGWDFLQGLINGSGWVPFGKAIEFVQKVTDILMPLSYIRDVYDILSVCTECLY